MPSFDEMRNSIYSAGQDISMRARNASESARIKNLIKNNEKTIDKLKYQVGNQCVEAHLQDENTEYEQLFAEIRRLREENQNYQKEIDDMTNVKVCPQCGTSNKTSAKFCIHCGCPLPDEDQQAAPADGKRCPNCGTMNDKDAAFCIECGTALPAAEPEEETVAEEPGPVEEEEPLTGKRCPNCGAINDEDSAFCIECGTPFPAAEPASEPEPEEEPEPTIDLSAYDEEAGQEESEPEPESEEEPEPEEESEPTIDLSAYDEENAQDESDFETEELGPVEEEEPLAGKRCPNCGTINDYDSMFCVECGSPLPEAEPEEPEEQGGSVYYCKNCGAPMADDEIFCTNCGTRRE